VKLDHATVLPSPKFDNPDRLGYTPNTPRETGGGGAHRCLLAFLFALSPLSTGCTPQQVFCSNNDFTLGKTNYIPTRALNLVSSEYSRHGYSTQILIWEPSLTAGGIQ
jgi:hypothetical protein